MGGCYEGAPQAGGFAKTYQAVNTPALGGLPPRASLTSRQRPEGLRLVHLEQRALHAVNVARLQCGVGGGAA